MALELTDSVASQASRQHREAGQPTDDTVDEDNTDRLERRSSGREERRMRCAVWRQVAAPMRSQGTPP